MMPAFDFLLRCLPGAAAARFGELSPAPGFAAGIAAIVLLAVRALSNHRLLAAAASRAVPPLLSLAVVALATPVSDGGPPGDSVDTARAPEPFAREQFVVQETRGRTAIVQRVMTGERYAFRFPPEERVGARGERFAMAGTCEAIPGPRNRGEPDWLRWTRDRGASGLLTAKATRRAAHAAPLTVRGMRERVHDTFDRWPGETGELARALVLGDRTGLSPETNERFRRLGVSHLLALSGLHTGILFGAIFTLIRTLRLSARIASPVSAIVLWVFGAVAGYPVSLCRSLVMLSFWSVAHAVSIPANPIQILAVTALVLGALDPAAVGEPGFLLSFVATGCILGGHRLWTRAGAPVAARLPDRVRRWSRVLWPFWMGACASVGTLPLQLIWFGIWAPAGIVWTVVLSPMLGLTLIAAAAAAAVADIPLLNALPWGDGAVLAAALFLDCASRLADLPIDPLLVEGRAAVGASLAVGGVTLAAICFVRRIWMPLLIVPLLIPSLPPKDDPGELVIDILDVGQGSAAVVRIPDGPVLLFDAGIGPAPYDRGASTVLPFLRRFDRLPVDRFYASHGDADHLGGALSMTTRGVLRGAFGGGVARTKVDRMFVETARGAGVPDACVLDRTIERWGDVELRTIYAPERTPHLDPNDASLVQIVSLGNFRIWFGGDAPSSREERLAIRGDADRMAVLIASHHGARASTPWSLLARARPLVAIVSCGRNNRYGHPHEETIRRLEGIGARIFRTDRHGGITIRTDGRTMRVETRLPRPARTEYALPATTAGHEHRRIGLPPGGAARTANEG